MHTLQGKEPAKGVRERLQQSQNARHLRIMLISVLRSILAALIGLDYLIFQNAPRRLLPNGISLKDA